MGSIAWKAGIEPGDSVVSINGRRLKDIFDYHYSMTYRRIRLKIKKRNSVVEKINIYKQEYEDIGISFKEDLINGEKSCTNKCIFCFIDQLPKGMRETLYYKDDDARLSLLHGNYVTLTNTGMNELKRMARLRISPINISVHTVNPELRVKMMANRSAGDIMEKIAFLAKKKIRMNCQAVLCRGINDGDEMARTINELSSLYPYVNSISIVPVGLTKYRGNLFKLEPYDKESSIEVLDMITGMQPALKERLGVNFAYAADEFYIMAGRETPGPGEYDGYPQIENGVGLLASFADEVREAIGEEKYELNPRRISILTGEAAFSFMKDMAELVMERHPGIEIEVFAVKNIFFGKEVTVAGLLTGNDIINALKGKSLGEELLLPVVMLRADDDIFLDDVTLSEISETLGVKVTPVNVSGFDFVSKITGRRSDA
ncbi:MAG: DUF512 domain-containing protein [Clostridia bacterium]|nr:DUF512 domain-containing protein [Clostridia bacterium]